jgi:hypothetical protein
VSQSIARSIGVACTGQGLQPEHLDPAWLAEHRDTVATVASKVTVSHDWARTSDLVEHHVDVAAPLFAGVTMPELREAGKMAKVRYDGGLPLPGGQDLMAIVKRRPDLLMDRIKHASGNLADARLEEWQFRFGAQVRLYSTRGGVWPEKRLIPEGSPGWPWARTVESVQTRYGATHPEGVLAAQRHQATTGENPASEWVHQLIDTAA